MPISRIEKIDLIDRLVDDDMRNERRRHCAVVTEQRDGHHRIIL